MRHCASLRGGAIGSSKPDRRSRYGTVWASTKEDRWTERALVAPRSFSEDPALASPSASAWTRQFGTRQADEVQAVALDGSGNAYVVGWTFGTLPGQASAGTLDAFVRKVDPGGNELWTRQFGSWDSDFARSVAVGPYGDVYVVGETDGTLPGQHSAGGRDAFIRRYDPDGTERSVDPAVRQPG
jgi:hypothetical protein